MQLRDATAHDVPRLARVLARAMADDPWVRFLLGGDDARRYFEVLLGRFGVPAGAVRCTDDAAVVAFAPPGLPGLLPLARAFGPVVGWRRIPALAEALAAVAALRPTAPSVHLAEIGVDPDAQGQGLGTVLLRDVLDRADHARRPVLVETARDDLVGWYEAHGFEPRGAARLAGGDDGRRVHVLWRPARSALRVARRRALLHAGVAEVDLAPPLGLPLAGHGLAGAVARGTAAPLVARVVAIEGEDGLSALVVADLLSGTGALRSAIEERTGLHGRVILAGTHTHHGPAGLFGNPLYDTLAGARPGADPARVDLLAGRIGSAIGAASSRLVPARVGAGRAIVDGDLLRSASPRAGARVDPEVTALAFVGPDGPLAVLGVAAAHASALDAAWPFYSPDWPGVAVAVARRGLGCPVALGAGAGADVNVLGGGEQGPRLVHVAGVAVGRALARAAADAIAYAEPVSASLAGAELDVTTDPDLDRDWAFGVAALGGAPDGRTLLHPLGLARPRGLAAFPPGHPQHPKCEALGPLQGPLRTVLAGPTRWPVHLLTLGPHRLATVPGEPTVALGARIRRALGGSAAVLGCAGEYAGYFTTPEEYDAQEYEGASVLFGRASGERVLHAILGLAASATVAGCRSAGSGPGS